MDKVLKNSIWLFAIYLFLFLIHPEIDYRFSAIFFDGTFVEKGSNIETFIYDSVDILSMTLFVVLAILLIVVLKKGGVYFGIFDKRSLIFLLTFFILTSGIVVNMTLKEFSGRARPSKVVQFGGSQELTPPLLKAYECDNHNCSFSSGHSSLAFGMGVFALLLPLYKNLIFFAALIYGGLVSVARVAQGGHFLSDTIFSFFVVIFSMQLLYYLFYREKAPNYYAKNGLFFVIFFIILTFYYLHGYFLEKL